jgi:hypothetical protein
MNYTFSLSFMLQSVALASLFSLIECHRVRPEPTTLFRDSFIRWSVNDGKQNVFLSSLMLQALALESLSSLIGCRRVRLESATLFIDNPPPQHCKFECQ